MSFKDLQPGFSYLVNDNFVEAYKQFNQFVMDKERLCITRKPPERRAEMFKLEDVEFKWLTNLTHPNAVRPTDLHIIFPFIVNFLDKGDSVVMLDGLEYLIVHNGFDEVLKFIQSLRDQVYMKKGILLVPVSSDALEKKEIALMERELEPMEDVADAK